MNDTHFALPAEMLRPSHAYQMGFKDTPTMAFGARRFEDSGYESLKQANSELIAKNEKLEMELIMERRLVSTLEGMVSSLQAVVSTQHNRNEASLTTPSPLSLPTVSNVPPSPSEAACNVPYYKKGQWTEYVRKRANMNLQTYKLGFLTHENGVELNDDERRTISKATYELFTELFNTGQDPQTWGQRGSQAKAYITDTLRTRFPEFRYSNDDWKVELWVTAKYPDWGRDVRDKYLIPAKNLKRKQASPENDHPKKQRKVTKVKAQTIIKIEEPEVIEITDSEESVHARSPSPALEYWDEPNTESPSHPITAALPLHASTSPACPPVSKQSPKSTLVAMPSQTPALPASNAIADTTPEHTPHDRVERDGTDAAPIANGPEEHQLRGTASKPARSIKPPSKLQKLNPLADIDIPQVAITPNDPEIKSADIPDRTNPPTPPPVLEASNVDDASESVRFPSVAKGYSKRRNPMKPGDSKTARNLYAIDYLDVHPDTTSKEFAIAWADLVPDAIKKEYESRARALKK